MNKTEFVEALAKATGLTKKDAAIVVDSEIEIIKNKLKKKENVAIPGFGTFETSKRSARTGVNPQTGDKIKIPARTVPKFRPGKLLKEAVAKK